MDLLKAHKRRSKLSEAAYVTLNVGLAVALLVIVLVGQSPWLAVVVVLMSKWRALAVRPRFWFANLVANMVDIIVGVSMVVLLYGANGSLWLQIALTVLYIIWLLLIKPRSKRSFVAAQAGIAVFLGVTALSMISYSWDSLLFVAGMWVIGYVTIRHVLGSYEEPLTMMYSLVGGALFAEMGWIGFHWMMAYPLPGFGTIQLSQLALFMVLFCFDAERAYASYHRHGVVRRQDILAPFVLTAGILAMVYVLAVINGNNAL
ncbi:MAG: hypothetical protein KDA17_02355 [Candidatus Saccharibacteria bacterium]|jgi:hypothetical protein|nr:hypothetical protein [Candidatus Saccharibacteria bacterium]MCA9339730.1 hypothetical protein [Candidatus Saccharibacteria bacterium]